MKSVNDPAANRLGAEFEDGTRPLSSFKDSLFQGGVRDVIRKFENSAIAYSFTFDLTEVNKLDAGLDLTWPFTRGAGSAALSAGVDRTRENFRTFTVTDTFIGLFTTIKDGYCSQFDAGGNYLYPIVGTIGIDEMIRTFGELSLFGNLSGDPKGGPPTLGDAISFTTTLSGSAVPRVVLSPMRKVLQIADASFTASASRTDVHKVIVGLSLPTSHEMAPAAMAPTALASAAFAEDGRISRPHQGERRPAPNSPRQRRSSRSSSGSNWRAPASPSCRIPSGSRQLSEDRKQACRWWSPLHHAVPTIRGVMA